MTWFSPPGVVWRPVSLRLIPARLLLLWLVLLVPLGASFAVAAAAGGKAWALPGAVLAIGAWVSWIAWRQVTVHAWAEREDDVMVRRGRVFRRVTVVPYGRMQYVEVAAGPIARALGIARVQLHTASRASDAHISGVPSDEAARLRDRLTERGESRLAGL